MIGRVRTMHRIIECARIIEDGLDGVMDPGIGAEHYDEGGWRRCGTCFWGEGECLHTPVEGYCADCKRALSEGVDP